MTEIVEVDQGAEDEHRPEHRKNGGLEGQRQPIESQRGEGPAGDEQHGSADPERQRQMTDRENRQTGCHDPYAGPRAEHRVDPVNRQSDEEAEAEPNR